MEIDPRPQAGVYGGTVQIATGDEYLAGIVIMDQKGDPKIEAHLIGFDGDLYGQKVMFTLKNYVRGYAEFENEEELKEQIGKDLEIIQNTQY